MTDQIVANITQNIQKTLSADPGIRRDGENHLEKLRSSSPLYGVYLLQTVVSTPNIDENYRLATVLAFKNYIKSFWKQDEGDGGVPEVSREEIKKALVQLLLNVESNRIHQQLSAALSIICETDFPEKWPTLLPELVGQLKSGHIVIIIRVLRTCSSIFKRFRTLYGSDEDLHLIKYGLNFMQEPLLEIFKFTVAKIPDPNIPPEECKSWCTTLHLLLKIFISLSSVDLPEFFENSLQVWMTGFLQFLKFENPPAILLASTPNNVGILYKVQATICEILNLFTVKYPEEFSQYVNHFVETVWQLLMKVDNDTQFDNLVTSCIKFLCSIAKSSFSEVFNNRQTLQTICERVVLPHLYFRDSDEELFEFNHIEYIRRDIEGSDNDTRRRAACELVKALRTKYETVVTEVFSAYILQLFQTYSQKSTEWKAKDAAIYLVTALAVKSATVAQGTISVNPLVPVGEIFSQHILPELQTQNDPNQNAVIIAACLKFTVTFRNQLPLPLFQSLFPLFIRLAASESAVVQTYSAYAIEKFLTVRESGSQNANATNSTSSSVPLRFGKTHLNQFFEPVLAALFKILATDESKENDYVMKAILRVLIVGDEFIPRVVSTVLPQVVQHLSRIYKNPTNPHFNHYLFEAVGLMIKTVGKLNPDSIPSFLTFLFPVFEAILNEDITEFAPYVFQLMSVLLEVSPKIDGTFLALFPNIVSPNLWARTGNIPALVRLLQAYLRRGSSELFVGGHLQTLLAIARRLLDSTIHDHEGFFLLESIVQYSKLEAIQSVVSDIFSMIFGRLTAKKTTKFVRSFLVFLSLFLGLHGPSFVVSAVDSLQPNLFGMILTSLWIPDVAKVNGAIERKVTAYGTVLLILSPEILQKYPQSWPGLLGDFVNIMEHGEDERLAEGDVDATGNLAMAEEETAMAGGLQTAFSRLLYCAKDDEDPFPNVRPVALFATKFPELVSNSPQAKAMVDSLGEKEKISVNKLVRV